MSKYNFNDDKYLSNSFICYRWMNVLCQEHDISEGAKNLYALVFSFTKDGRHEFVASQQYIADMLYCSISSVKRYTKELTDSNLIDKGYTKIYDASRVMLKLNNDIIKEFFDCDLKDIYSIVRDQNGEKILDIKSYSSEDKNDNKTKQLLINMSVSNKNGIIHSKEIKKHKDKKENKYTKFVDCLYNSNYPDKVIDAGKQYVKWLLGNRKVELEQWELTIKNFNSELKLINSKQIREEAAIDAFNTAFSCGYQKLSIDKYKYGKYISNNNNKLSFDTQKSDSKIEEVSKGVYKVVQNSSIDFVKDLNGNILTF